MGFVQPHSKQGAFTKSKMVCQRSCLLKETYAHEGYHQISTHLIFIPSVLMLFLQMAAKIGGDQPNMNSSASGMEPSLYGFGGQKRSLDNGGKPLLHSYPECAVSGISEYIHSHRLFYLQNTSTLS